MKEDIILIGSGQHARVVLYNLEAQGQFNIVAMLDSDKKKVGKNFEGISIFATYSEKDLAETKKKYKTNKFFIGFGNMKYRKRVFEFMTSQGWEPVNIIHPNAIIAPNAKIGKGVLIECGCLITPNPNIGNNVVINTGAQVNHDNVVEDHVYIASGVILSGGVMIKENTLLDDGCIITLGRTVGKNCVIGAGAVVTKDITDNMIAFGNPCKEIRANNY